MIENYNEAVSSSEQFELHHRLELTLDGEFAHTAKELKRLGMYYHRPYFELIFLPRTVHARIHGLAQSSDKRSRISSSQKGISKSLRYRQYMKDVAKEFRLHKASGGTMTWNEFQSSFKAARSEI